MNKKEHPIALAIFSLTLMLLYTVQQSSINCILSLLFVGLAALIEVLALFDKNDK